jgi:Arc/MetJ family transcription regulator
MPHGARSGKPVLAWLARALPIPFRNVYNWLSGYTSMRTNIVIDDMLMRDTLRASGLKTKREAVDQALRTFLRLRKQAEIRRLRGKLDWQGDLNAMRSDS